MNQPIPHPSLLKQAAAAAIRRRAVRTLRRALLDDRGGPRASRPRRIGRSTRCCPTRSCSRTAPRRSRRSWPVLATRGAGDRVRHRVVARGSPARDPRRVVARRLGDEPGRRGQRRGPDGDGAGRRDAQAAQRRDQGHRLFFPIDPGADASLGGMAATRASGTNAVRYGTMRENVVSLTVVTADGKIVRTARRARKSSAGYDLTRIFVGSEGTLGIITEVTVKLYPQPEAISAAVCNFPTVDDAVRCVIETIQMGVPVARVELLDAAFVRAVNVHSKLDVEGDAAAAVRVPRLRGEREGAGGDRAGDREPSTAAWSSRGRRSPEDRTKLWTARHNAYFAGLQVKPGTRAITTDVCVPISRLAESIGATVADCETLEPAVADPRPRRRRQLPRDAAGRSGESRGVRGGREDQPARSCRAPSSSTAPAPASTASACTRCSSSSRSTARTRST